jgi:hypothetical protein
MLCYECSQSKVEVPAIGVCHYCSAGLCAAHAHVDAEPVRVMRRHRIYGTIKQTINLPDGARRLLCEICWQALRERQASDVVLS